MNNEKTLKFFNKKLIHLNHGPTQKVIELLCEESSQVSVAVPYKSARMSAYAMLAQILSF